MANFIGEYVGKIDDKGRLVLPASFRAKEIPEGGSLIVHKNIFEPFLDLYTPDEWQKYSDEVLVGIKKHTREGNKTWMAFNRHRAEISVDEKTGRINIPKALLDLVAIDKDVVFYGNGNKIGLWAKAEWDKFNEEMDDKQLADSYEKLMKENQ